MERGRRGRGDGARSEEEGVTEQGGRGRGDGVRREG